MTDEQAYAPTTVIDTITASLQNEDLTAVSAAVGGLSTFQIVDALERLSARQRAVAYRLLPKQTALEVFESLEPSLQGELVSALQDTEVAALFAELDPDDRVWLMDELPAVVAKRLLHGLPEADRQLTAGVLGYPSGSIGRRMSPEVVTTHPESTVRETMTRLRARLDDAETVYTLPVLDDVRRIVGVVSLRDLLGADDDETVETLMRNAHTATATEDAEIAARRCAELGLLALPVVDSESRRVGAPSSACSHCRSSTASRGSSASSPSTTRCAFWSGRNPRTPHARAASSRCTVRTCRRPSRASCVRALCGSSCSRSARR